jgi:hypothetical protein
MACGRSPTGAAPIDNTTCYATLIINSNNCHGEYMQPGWIFCVNCHGRHFAGDAPNSLARICPVRFAARHRREHRTGPQASTTGFVRRRAPWRENQRRADVRYRHG